MCLTFAASPALRGGWTQGLCRVGPFHPTSFCDPTKPKSSIFSCLRPGLQEQTASLGSITLVISPYLPLSDTTPITRGRGDLRKLVLALLTKQRCLGALPARGASS